MDRETLKKHIKTYPDFPQKGIAFKDISPILSDQKLFTESINKLQDLIKDKKFDALIAIDARGFIFASPLALIMRKGLVMCRKKGKLPGPVETNEFSYEYATAGISIQKSALPKGAKVIIVDDVLATGHTAKAAFDITKSLKLKVVAFLFFSKISFLEGEKFLQKECRPKTQVITLLDL